VICISFSLDWVSLFTTRLRSIAGQPSPSPVPELHQISRLLARKFDAVRLHRFEQTRNPMPRMRSF
jgi:hypothetical protein